MPDVPGELLHRRWVHSYEEDTDTEMVFRPDSYEFPPARGRVSFELREDGTFEDRGIGPTDRPDQRAGRWEAEDDRRIVLREEGTGEVRRRLQVESVGEDRLVVKK